jgi:hypothetical protein
MNVARNTLVICVDLSDVHFQQSRLIVAQIVQSLFVVYVVFDRISGNRLFKGHCLVKEAS